MAREVVIAGACRTPIGKFQGTLQGFKAPELGAIVAREALRRAGVKPEQVDEVIFGNVLQAGLGQNPARQAALKGGLPPGVGCFTVNKVCGSGLKSIILAAQAIRAGDAECVLAGGMESMTNAPYLMPSARGGARLGHTQLLDAMIVDGLWEAFEDYHMGHTAELVQKEHGIGREEMDAYAADSHAKAARALAEGRFKEEVVPVPIPQKKGDPVQFDTDEGVRAETTRESLKKLRPVFVSDGTVTAGNASQLSDGAAALVVMSRERAEQLGVTPLARLTGWATAGLEPKWVMMTPVPAVKNLEARTGKDRKSYDLYELNEAFAVQACAVQKELGLAPEKVNVNGGAIALGHPIGASGARIVVTLLHALRQRNLRTGLASLCMGGANGLALSLERL